MLDGRSFSVVFNGRERLTTYNENIILINLRRSFGKLSRCGNMLGI